MRCLQRDEARSIQQQIETDKGTVNIEVRKTVNLDSSYVEIITDHYNNRAEIIEYDAQGNRIQSTYVFLDEMGILGKNF